MALVTHNIVAPTSWSVYDQIDRPLPRSQGLYPDPDSPLPRDRYLTVTPSQQQQVLPTANKLVTGDIVVKPIPSNFYDTSDASFTAADLLRNTSAYGPNGLVWGTMPNNGSVGGTISTKTGTVSIPAGYTTGGTVSISTAEQAKIIAGNIKKGVTILGVPGSATLVSITQDSTTKVLSIS